MLNHFLYAFIILQLLLNFELTFGYPISAKNNGDICVSPACIHAASRMLKNMDSKVSPCDNFYKYSCGNFIKSTHLADTEHSQDSYTQSAKKLINELRSLISLENFANDTKPLRIAKDLYQACLNTTAIDKQGLDEIKKIIKNTGGWPVLDGDKWNETSFDWVETTYKLSKIGYAVSYLVNVELKPKLLNLRTKSIHLTQPKLLNVSKEYVTFMHDVAVMFGANPKYILKDMSETLAFAKEIVEIVGKKTREQYKITTLHRYKKKKALPIDWNKYISLQFDSNVTLPNETTIIVETPVYYNKLALLLNKTSNKTIANYIMWNIVEESIAYLSKEIRNISSEYIRNDIENDFHYHSRDTHCFNMVYNKLPTIMDTVYFKNIFDKNIKRNVTKITENIKNELVNVINHMNWIDNKTNDIATKRSKYVKNDIAYSDDSIDDTKIEKLYKDLEINKSCYLQSSLNINLYKRKLQFQIFLDPSSSFDNSFLKSYREVNAFYKGLDNTIYIPAGILGDLFFNNDYPSYINYGNIGFIIGHELTHGFVQTRRYFTNTKIDNKVLNKSSYESEDSFFDKTQCFIKQYDNYTIEEIQENANGSLTLEENMADNGGIKLSYSAYKSLSKEHEPEKKLPGFESFTSDQMFWLSFANTWCSKVRPELLSKIKQSDEHSLPEHRLLGALSNDENFSNDFNCQSGSPMNPINKCSLFY